MTDDGRRLLSHERDKRTPIASQFVHQISFFSFSEGSLVHGPNGLEFSGVVYIFNSNADFRRPRKGNSKTWLLAPEIKVSLGHVDVPGDSRDCSVNATP